MELLAAPPPDCLAIADPSSRGPPPLLRPGDESGQTAPTAAPFELLLGLLGLRVPGGDALPATGNPLPATVEQASPSRGAPSSMADTVIGARLRLASSDPAVPQGGGTSASADRISADGASSSMVVAGEPSGADSAPLLAAPLASLGAAAPSPQPSDVALSPVLTIPSGSASGRIAAAGDETAPSGAEPEFRAALDVPTNNAARSHGPPTAAAPELAADKDSVRLAAMPANPAPPVVAKVLRRDDAAPELPTIAAVSTASTSDTSTPVLPVLPSHAAPAANLASANPTIHAPADAGSTVDTRAPGWHEALAQRIQVLVDHRVGEARIKLNPPELGAVDVKISLVEDKTYVQLTAHSSAARDELTQSLPRLRDLLTTNGLELGGASVHGGRTGNDGRDDAPRGGPTSRAFAPLADEISTSRASAPTAGRIDLFA